MPILGCEVNVARAQEVRASEAGARRSITWCLLARPKRATETSSASFRWGTIEPASEAAPSVGVRHRRSEHARAHRADRLHGRRGRPADPRAGRRRGAAMLDRLRSAFEPGRSSSSSRITVWSSSRCSTGSSSSCAQKLELPLVATNDVHYLAQARTPRRSSTCRASQTGRTLRRGEGRAPRLAARCT